jgi:nitroreductase
MEEFEKIIFGRRSVRRYLDQPIPLEIIQKILEAAIYAPTASNIQPWVFGIVTDAGTIKTIEGFSPGMPRGSKVIIAVCSDHKLAEIHGGNPNLCTLDCAMAGENLQLAAYQKGIGSCVCCSFNRPAVSAILKLPAHVYLEFTVTLGYALKEPRTLARKPVERVSFINEWRGNL